MRASMSLRTCASIVLLASVKAVLRSYGASNRAHQRNFVRSALMSVIGVWSRQSRVRSQTWAHRRTVH
jgi:hypothetical protein